MNRYPDATAEELSREDTCIICREEMRPWDPANEAHTIDRVRPKKLPCGHILHLGCLKSWLERQQVCPTCRRPVTGERPRGEQNRGAGLRIEIGGGRRQEGQGQQAPPANNGVPPAAGHQNGAQGQQQQQQGGGPRIFNLGPIRLGFGANGQQVRELAQQFGLPQGAVNQPWAPGAAGGQQAAPAPAPAPTPTPTTNPMAQTQVPPMTSDNLQNISALLSQADQMVQRELLSLQATQLELQTINLLTAELHRLRQRHQQQDQTLAQQPVPSPGFTAPPIPQIPPFNPYQVPPQVTVPQMPTFPSYPSVPPRTQSPLISRYGAPGNAPAIPSGSSELPEGVVIPPGWSLLPLQRLDASQSTTHPSPQTGPQTMDGEGSTVSHSTPNPVTAAAAAAPPPMSSSNNGDSQASSTLLSSTAQREDTPHAPPPTETVPFERTVETTPVVAPSPRAPNWGGSAQLFGRSNRLDSDASSPQPEPQAEPSADRNGDLDSELPAEGDSLQLPRGSSSDVSAAPTATEPTEADKGKGKAVTVEEADEDSSGAE